MSHAVNSTETTKDIFTIDAGQGVAVRAEGMNEPVYFKVSQIDTVLDLDADIWARNTVTDLFYLPLHEEEPEDADTTLEQIEAEYGITDINVRIPAQPEAPKEPAPSQPAYQRGDITINDLSGREALVLDRVHNKYLGWVYTVIEKGHVYPAAVCPQQPGGAMFMESMLNATGQHFNEDEILMLTLLYSL